MKTPVVEVCFSKVATFEPATFQKWVTHGRCFLVNILKIFRTAFLLTTYG